MALLTLSAAARAVGKDRTTIHRKVKSGELSAVHGPTGEKRIDTSELERVFGPLQNSGNATQRATVAQQEAATPSPTAPDATQMALVDMLRSQLSQATQREQWLREQLEAEQQTRRELETRLLPPPGQTTAPGSTDRTTALAVGLVLAFLALTVIGVFSYLSGAH